MKYLFRREFLPLTSAIVPGLKHFSFIARKNSKSLGILSQLSDDQKEGHTCVSLEFLCSCQNEAENCAHVKVTAMPSIWIKI